VVGCVSVSGSQTFETSSDYSVPAIGGVSGSGTISAVSAENAQPFAKDVLKGVNKLRDNSHVTNFVTELRISTIELSTNTNFAGVNELRLQWISDGSSDPLCDRSLSASDQESSTITCDIAYDVDVAKLENSTSSSTPAQIGVQLQVSGESTATRMTSTVTFEVSVSADIGL
jgi:hypothetical protein